MWAAKKEHVRHRRCSELGMRAWVLLGGDWLAQVTSEHVPFLRSGAENQRFGPCDDVTVKASREDAEWPIQKCEERYEIKTQMIGEVVDLDQQLQIRNRTVRWSSRGLRIEADPRHVKEVIKALGLEGAIPAPTPGVAVKGDTGAEENETIATSDGGTSSSSKHFTTVREEVNLLRNQMEVRSRVRLMELKSLMPDWLGVS